MKKGIFKKLFTGALACMMCMTAIPSEPDTFAAADRCDQGKQDGYDWELWNQWDQGTANMQLLGNGKFSCEWSGIENVLFRTGKKWTSNSPQWDTLDGITMDYAADYQPNGNSYLSVYGWTKSPLVEYYIIESWGTWRPPGGTGYKDTITVDGIQYDVYQTTRVQQPSIEGTKTFPQYFSVRKEGDKSTSGTVDIAKHFAAWESLGLDMGGLYEVSLVVEGYQSSGKATVTKNDITLGGGFDPDDPTTPTTPVEPDENGYYFHSTYESGTDSWSARGSNSAAVSGSASAKGSKSLFVSDRTETWNGAGYSLNKNAFVPGNSYSFSTMVMQNAAASEDMKLSLQYDDASGETQYATVAEATASKGEWTQLKNTSFTIPSGASNMLLYVETNEGLIDFYMDEAIGAVDGTVIPSSGGSSSTDEPDEPDTPETPDGDYYFHSTYESDEDDWASRGDTTLQLSGKAPYAGKNSLLVSGRTDAWNGAGYTLSSSVFKPGNSYSFSAMAMQDTETAVDFKLSLQYDDASGETQYATVAEATGTKGNWTQLANTDFQIPSGATNMLLYVETSESLTNFYMDEAIGAAAGTVIDADIKASAGDVNEDGKIDSKDLTALRDFIMGNSSSASAETSDLDENGRVDSLDLAALRKLLTTPATDDNTTTQPEYSSDSLVGKFGHLFKMGTSVSPNELNTGADFIKKHFNSITPENALKPEAIIDQSACQQRGNNVNTQINLNQAASTLKFCEDNNIGVRGHTFVWYSQTPDWFFKENFSSSGAYVSKEIMNQRLESMIKNTFEAIKTQYPNLNLYAYDVCNELFLNDGGGLREPGGPPGSHWAAVYGANNDEFIINAFTYARKYAPAGCKLYINDYNEYVGNKTNDIYNIAMKLKDLGIIDGIGMQSHLDIGYPNAATYKAALEKFLSTGLEVSITELDITESSYNSQAQADLFKAIFEMAVDNYKQIPSFTVWGTHDSISWRGDRTPLLFGSGYTPKKAYDAVMSVSVPQQGDEYSNSSNNSNNNNNNNNTTTTPGVTDISWIDTSKPMVALSFDDGPISTAQNSAPIRIQNAIAENGFHATFFYWGERITSANEAEITRAHNLGFEVANHTYTHPYLTNLSADGIKQEIQKTADILTRLTGKTKFLIRPPYLAVNSTVQQNVGAPLITCSVDSQDWNGASSQQIIDTIVSKMNDGSLDNSVVLMHENYDSTATAIEYLVPYLKQNGWQVVTVSEMFMANNKTLVDGTVYSSAK